MTFDTATSLRLIREGLGLLDQLGAKALNVRNVELTEQMLVVEITADSANGVALRAEVCGVMGALSGLDVPTVFPALGVRVFGVRAFSPTGDELIWIISSIEAAADAGAGRPIEWLSRSVVQENTGEYRRAQADRIVGQLETALRDLIEHHGGLAMSGRSFESVLWSADRLRDMRRSARLEGRDPTNPRVLLEFVYLTDLRDLVAAHAAWFSDGCVPDAPALTAELSRLNLVRRKIAHHRPIEDADLVVLGQVAPIALGPIGAAHPSIATDYLADRWDEQAVAVMEAAQQGMNVSVPESGTVSEPARRQAAADGLEAQRAAIAIAHESMKRLVVPASRSQLGSRATVALAGWLNALEEISALAARLDATLAEVEAGQRRYSEALAEVHELGRQMKAIRLGLHP
jgi:hypothetical protein